MHEGEACMGILPVCLLTCFDCASRERGMEEEAIRCWWKGIQLMLTLLQE